MVHQHVQRLRRLLSSSETKRLEAEAKLADAEFMLAEREAELLERERVIVALQATKESLQNTLKDSMKATDTGHLARLAFEEEIALLRERSGVIQDSLESLEEDKLLRKQNEYKAKSSLLRSFRWKEKEVDPVVLPPGWGNAIGQPGETNGPRGRLFRGRWVHPRVGSQGGAGAASAASAA